MVYHSARLEVTDIANDFAFKFESAVFQLLPTQVGKVGTETCVCNRDVEALGTCR